METSNTRVAGSFVHRLIADYRLACFARELLETKSVAAAVVREE